MTLGQHIQFLRKKAGLSQEALGEMLGVSRQAVSKWEADAAIPELDTLIALSRIFEISLGALLQLEEPTTFSDDSDLSQSSDPAAANDQLEDILQKYIDQTRHDKERHKRIGLAAAGLTSVILLCAGIYAVGRINTLQQNISHLESQISNLRSSVNSEINSITYRISEALEEQDNILADYSMTPTEIDIENGRLRYHLTASLKEVNTASTGKFLVDYTMTDGKTGSTASEELTGPVFDGYVWLPYNFMADVKLLVTDPDGTQRTQKIDTIHDAHEDYYRITGEAHMGYTMRPRSDDRFEFTIDGTYQVFYPFVPKGINFDLSLKEIKVEIYHNEDMVASADLVPVDDQGDLANTEAAIQVAPPDQAFSVAASSTNQTYGLAEAFQLDLSVKEGDIIKAIFSLTDNYGRTTFDLNDRDKAVKIIRKNNSFTIQSIELTEDMLP